MTLTACSTVTKHEVVIPKTEFVYMIPDVVSRPVMPELKQFNPNTGLNSRENFRIFQDNVFIMHEHVTDLHRTIDYYENHIKKLQEKYGNHSSAESAK